MSKDLTGFSNLCIHTITTKPWSIEKSAAEFSKAGIGGISVWRDALEGRNIPSLKKLLQELNLRVVSLCRGGFFPSADQKQRQRAIEDKKHAEIAAEQLQGKTIQIAVKIDAEGHMYGSVSAQDIA
ncbi:MAG: 50S ribosomal L9 C-terminal domain-containing protein, partial [Chitinophagales bacterium]